jgi:hypothetical protein
LQPDARNRGCASSHHVPPARPADRQKSGDVDFGAIMPGCTIARGGVFAALSRLAKVFAAIGKLDNPKRLAQVSQLALANRIAYRRMCDLDAELRIDRLSAAGTLSWSGRRCCP